MHHKLYHFEIETDFHDWGEVARRVQNTAKCHSLPITQQRLWCGLVSPIEKHRKGCGRAISHDKAVTKHFYELHISWQSCDKTFLWTPYLMTKLWQNISMNSISHDKAVTKHFYELHISWLCVVQVILLIIILESFSRHKISWAF